MAIIWRDETKSPSPTTMIARTATNYTCQLRLVLSTSSTMLPRQILDAKLVEGHNETSTTNNNHNNDRQNNDQQQQQRQQQHNTNDIHNNNNIITPTTSTTTTTRHTLEGTLPGTHLPIAPGLVHEVSRATQVMIDAKLRD